MTNQSSIFSQSEFSPRSLLRMLWKRRYLAALLWVATVGLGALAIYKLPRSYSAEASLLLSGQGIPEKYVSSSINPDVTERMEVLKQKIVNADRLWLLIEQYDLYASLRHVPVPTPREEIITRMRGDLTMRLERGWSAERSVTFRVAYKSRNPVIAAEVANRVARFFIDENIRDRESWASTTSDFLTAELGKAKQKMDSLDEILERYKRQFNGELPQQEQAMIASLAQSKMRLQSIQDALSRAEQTKLILKNTLETARASESMARQLLPPAPAAAIPSAQPLLESDRIRTELAQLRQRYGEQHPDLRRLQAVLETTLQREQNEFRSHPAAAPAARPAETVAAIATPRPENMQALIEQRERIENLKTQIQVTDAEQVKLVAERASVYAEVNKIERHLMNMPVREQEMAGVMREHESAKLYYQSLLEKKLNADLASNMERRRQGEVFSQLDLARAPEVPVSPNLRMLAAAVLAFATLLALAVSIGLGLKKGLLQGEWELPPNVVVLARVPELDLAASR